MADVLTDDQVTALRVWVGDDPTLGELQSYYDLTDSLNSVVISALTRKLALASEQPSSLSVPGLSISYGTLIQNIQALMASFLVSGGIEGETSMFGLTIGHLVRPSRR